MIVLPILIFLIRVFQPQAFLILLIPLFKQQGDLPHLKQLFQRLDDQPFLKQLIQQLTYLLRPWRLAQLRDDLLLLK